MAPAVRTFIETHDFTGEIVVPFITYSGWPAHEVSDMIDGLKGAKIKKENEIQFDSTYGDELVTEMAEIDEWISNFDLSFLCVFRKITWVCCK